MGRWAEVYFTSPPEKREQAVLELLRELQTARSDRAPRPVNSAPARPQVLEEAPVRVEAAADEASVLVPCNTCGRKNAASNKFCGMCGALLTPGETAEEGSTSAAADQPTADEVYDEQPASEPDRRTEPATGGHSYQPAPYERARYGPSSYEAAPSEPASRNTNELSLFQSAREDSGDG